MRPDLVVVPAPALGHAGSNLAPSSCLLLPTGTNRLPRAEHGGSYYRASPSVLERRLEKPTTQERHDREFRISPAVNAGLRLLARAEHRLRRLGLPMPFGGSQVLVAERPD